MTITVRKYVMLYNILFCRFECKIAQSIPTVVNVSVRKTHTAVGAPLRISARFGATVEMRLKTRCIGSHTNQDDAPQSLLYNPMNCSEPLPGTCYTVFLYLRFMHM